MELTLTDSELMIFRRMIEHSDEVFFMFNTSERQFTYINAAFLQITNISSNNLIADPESLYAIVHNDDREFVKRNFKNLLRRKSTSLLDFRIFRPDNTERWVRLKVYPIVEDEKVAYITGIMEDDSARKAGILNMQKINGMKDSMLEILAHDLRGPIGIVKMLASAISNKMSGDEHAQIRDWTGLIEEISKKNIALIHNLIEKETPETAGTEMSKERLDVVWEAEEVMKMFISSQVETRKRFEFTSSHPKIFARLDSMKFMQILNNLVSNAIKFTGDEGLVKVHLEKMDTTLLMTVEDDGVGIPKSLHPVLFRKYTEAGRTGTDGQSTIGLGMWIVEKFTLEHGGRIWFESEEGKGSKFYVEVPRGDEDEIAD